MITCDKSDHAPDRRNVLSGQRPPRGLTGAPFPFVQPRHDELKPKSRRIAAFVADRHHLPCIGAMPLRGFEGQN